MRLTRHLVPVLVAAAGLAAPLAIAPTAQAAAVTCAGLKATIVGNDKGTTILMVTHDPELAMRAQRNVHIIDGRASDLQRAPTLVREAARA